MIYLDHAATTPVLREALEAAWPWLTSEFGNASSQHELGKSASRALEAARAEIAEALGCRTSEINFTSGATESINTALVGMALARPRGKHIITAETEHEATLETVDFLKRVHGFEVTMLPVSETGRIVSPDLFAALRPDTTLVSLMLVNNEIGMLHDIATFSEIAHTVDARFHCDAVQGLGWTNFNLRFLKVDALSLSGHKLGAPKGIGILYLNQLVNIEPLLHGGGHENGMRSGTQNVAWAVAMAKAITLRQQNSLQEARRGHQLLERFINRVLRETDAQLTGPTLESQLRAPSIASFTFRGVSGEALLLELERQGVYCSSGSACAAGSDEPSHVLTALGIHPEIAQTAVRFSIGHETTAEELDQAVEALKVAIANLQA